MKYQILASLTLALTTTFATAGGEEWMTDFSAAKTKAATENKTLLVDFTGSDWCGWCIKLNEEVFDHEEFKKGVAEKFVLVELDYPKDDSKLSEETKAQNKELQEKYQIQGFPTILLMDAQGRPFAQTGYQAGGPEKYVSHLNELLKEGEAISTALESASKLEGVAKAKAYVAALELVPETQVSHYQGITDQISTLDPEDITGFTTKQKLKADLLQLENDISDLFDNEKSTEAPALIDQFIATHSLEADVRKDLDMMKLQIQMSIADQAGDVDAILKLIDEFVISSKVEGMDKQQTLSMKVGTLINAKRFDEVAAVADEIIAIDPDSEIGKMATEFKAKQLPEIIKNAEAQAPEEPASE